MTYREVPIVASSVFRQPGWLRLTAAVRRRLTGAAAVAAAAVTIGALAVAVPAAAASSGEVNAVGSGKCLDVPNLSTTAGTQLDIWSCNGGTNQIWTSTSSGQLTVYSGSSQMCMDAYGNGTTPGTKVDVWTCNGGANQQWNINSNGTITGVQSGLCLDVTGASTANGALVELWTCNGGSNQQWTAGSSSSGGGSLPGSFQWSSSGVLISPHSDSHNIIAVKDPSVVNYNGQWYVAASTVNSSGSYGMEFLSFSNWSQANSATPVYADQTAIGGGYQTAPMLFYFAPQNLWYLIYQTGNNAGYSTNSNIANPYGWTATKYLYSSEPSIVQQNSSGGWLDFSLICDSANCYLFSMDDNGHLYRSQTSLANFPNGMGNTVIAASNSNKYAFFEADNVYKVAGTNEYLLDAEGIASDGHRYFTAYTSTALNGSWTPLAATESNPFIKDSNVTFSGTAWTQDFSSGDMIRSSYDQTLTISPCKMQFLYQGDAPGSYSNYNAIPWRLGMVTQTNSTC
jgi:endo-1,4-beta-xylanase